MVYEVDTKEWKLEVHSTQIQRFHVVNVVHGDYEFNDRTQLEKVRYPLRCSIGAHALTREDTARR